MARVVSKLEARHSGEPSSFQYGEKVVLRLLYLTRSFELEKMGLEEGTLHDLKTHLITRMASLLFPVQLAAEKHQRFTRY